jgi:hypothetical protein
MAAFKGRTVSKALTGKLGFGEDRSGKHPTFERVHEGDVVGVTHMSHNAGGRDLSDHELAAMARQLGVRSPKFQQAIGSAISGDDFLALLLSEREAS